ncbi:MAG: hypothetical protein ACOH5I_20375 [Oligoflexus sp.]
MNIKMPQEQLIRVIKQQGSHYRDAGQIARRMKDLLAEQLKNIKRQHHRNCKAAVAERQALVDPEYQEAVDEYLHIFEQSLRSRIQFETHKMLFQARQSNRLYHLAAARLPKSRTESP